MTDVTSWEKDQRLVLNELTRNTDAIEALREDIGEIKIEIAMLKVKSGMWGAIGGIVVALPMIFVLYQILSPVTAVAGGK